MKHVLIILLGLTWSALAVAGDLGYLRISNKTNQILFPTVKNIKCIKNPGDWEPIQPNKASRYVLLESDDTKGCWFVRDPKDRFFTLKINDHLVTISLVKGKGLRLRDDSPHISLIEEGGEKTQRSTLVVNPTS